MKRATCFMALTASGDAEVSGQVPRIGQQHFGAAGLDECWAAERDRSDPRVGTDSVMRMSQHKMVTFVNGNVRGVPRWNNN
jgi:hypothetical protein